VRAEGPLDYDRVLKQATSPLVTIKFVLKVRMGGGMGLDEETEGDITGVMIDPKGLILCSNTQLGGFTAMLSRMMGPMGGDMSATPTDLKILIGTDPTEHEADLVARDTELDLAWIKMKEPGEKEYDHVDFAKGGELKVGDRVLAVRRLGKFFNRTNVVVEGHVGGKTAKPRDLFVPSGFVATAHGMPAYTSDLKPVGLIVLQAPDAEDMDSGPLAMFSMMSDMQDMMNGFILPAADVAKATQRAMESKPD